MQVSSEHRFWISRDWTFDTRINLQSSKSKYVESSWILNYKFGFRYKGLVCLKTWCHGRWGHFAFGPDMTWQPDEDLHFHFGETPFAVVWWWKCTTSLGNLEMVSPETSSACKLLLVAVLVADSVMREQEQQEDKAHSLFFPFEVEELLWESLGVFAA